MVSLEGIVTKCSLVRPKVVKSIHYNENQKKFHSREYRDQTMTANGAASTSVYPTEDDDGNPVSLVAFVKSYFLYASSLSQNTATAPTVTTKQSRFKRCPNEHPLDSSHAALTLSWTMTSWTVSSPATAFSLSVSIAP